MKTGHRLTALFGVLALSALSTARAIPLGEYISEGGRGRMTIEAGQGVVPFARLQSQGANAHECGLDGDVKGDVLSVYPADADGLCEVTLCTNAAGIEVGEGTKFCRAFCGARASYAGEYLRVAQRCTDNGRDLAKGRFSDLYEARKYAQAIAALRPMFDGCARTLFIFEEAGIRNDLAIAYYHLKERRACLDILEPLTGPKEEARLEELRIHEPVYYDSWHDIDAAAKTNARLCGSLP